MPDFVHERIAKVDMVQTRPASEKRRLGSVDRHVAAAARHVRERERAVGVINVEPCQADIAPHAQHTIRAGMQDAIVMRFVLERHAAQLIPAPERICEDMKPGLLREVGLRRIAAEVRVHERDKIARRRRGAGFGRRRRAIGHDAPCDRGRLAVRGAGSAGRGLPCNIGRRTENERSRGSVHEGRAKSHAGQLPSESPHIIPTSRGRFSARLALPTVPLEGLF